MLLLLLRVLFALITVAPAWTRSEIIRKSASSLPFILSCPTLSHVIILEGVWHNFNSKQSLDCTSQVGLVCCQHVTHLPQYEQACNGNSECVMDFKGGVVSTRDNKTSSSCLTESRASSVNYNCVPRRTDKFKSYEMCSLQKLILGDESPRAGFIHSPGYPNYYGNHRECRLRIQLAATGDNQKIEFYLISMSLEGLSPYTRALKDFLRLDQNFTLYGTLHRPIQIVSRTITNKSSEIDLYFESDWITTSQLSVPKGFLIYYEIFDLPPTETLNLIEDDLEDLKTEYASLVVSSPRGAASESEGKITSWSIHEIVISVGLILAAFGLLSMAFLLGRRLSRASGFKNRPEYVVSYCSPVGEEENHQSPPSYSYQIELNEKLRRMHNDDGNDEEERPSNPNESLLTANEYSDIQYVQSSY